MKTTFFNASGNEMSYQWFHVPFAYTKVNLGNKQLVIAEISRNVKRIAYALRNNDTGRIGIVRFKPIHEDRKRGKYFEYKGNKVFLKDVGVVL
ncbi:hypothetical protein [Vibrio phage XZ1]|uniref:Uncharacterized protein n=2 Tax=Schizotequatrovirus TaxID=1198137 RepID=V9M007_9CAUD|nr:hypothetical protein CF80_gp131 [Vibrio phage VH7D]YP_009201116.1 hypothetical protein AVU32_gp013 [Vibrio phage ValKK3]ALP47615.1 hypothetical protein phiST2_0109 [Vibrio phage phi-ST2]QBX06228.1 hypothetical protein Va3_275 [Vibrio phage Va3]QNJ54853.1 hypothetical protein vBValMR10Z_313 [Vibrio phage vB_ValM_R10Z]QNJ55240.1 hypothetical protein vBValMR11Z_314 [Vibrio phage vB_ValM_R11Z]UOL51282.1 hypothetical protein [Vibrio phage XZ1]URQ03447.1 hypothetical protein PVA23_70 [Vibrio ph